jgi:thymidylate synthase
MNRSSYPFICKICGRESYETQLVCDNEDYCVCKDGYGCKKEKSDYNLFKSLYNELLNNGIECSPRFKRTLEIENFKFIFTPYTRFVNFKSRNLNLNYIKREFLWYLNGNKFDLSILKYAKMWENFVNDDGSIQSNYGQYIFNKNLNQFDNVVRILSEDIESRRAVMIILQPYHLMNGWKEYPCTYNLSFRIRNNKLNMTVKMRSQDAYLGFASDIPIFSFIHEMIYVVLKYKYIDLQIGDYCHFVDSFHIYENHFDFLKNINVDEYKLIDCPKIYSKDEVNFIIDFSKTLDKIVIPENYKFAKWLSNFD